MSGGYLADQLAREFHTSVGPLPLSEDGPGAPPPAPGPLPCSLVGGAIGRGLADAQESYRAELLALWPDFLAALPDDPPED